MLILLMANIFFLYNKNFVLNLLLSLGGMVAFKVYSWDVCKFMSRDSKRLKKNFFLE